MIGIVYPIVDVDLHDAPQPGLAVGMSRADPFEPLCHFLEVLLLDRQQEQDLGREILSTVPFE